MMKLPNDISIFTVTLTIQKIHSSEKCSCKSSRFNAAYGICVYVSVLGLKILLMIPVLKSSCARGQAKELPYVQYLARQYLKPCRRLHFRAREPKDGTNVVP